MERERSTEQRDLPHDYEEVRTLASEEGRCAVCGRSRTSALHQQEAEQASEQSTIERERGT